MAASEYLNWEQLAQEHESVGVHLHAPLTRKAGHPVYSVLDKGGKVLGQTTEGALENPQIHIDRFALEQALNIKSKTRNTMVVGRPIPSAPEGERVPLRTRAGEATVGDTTVYKAERRPGTVRIRETIPRAERTPGGPGKRLGAPREGIVVPAQPSKSDVFASGVEFGRSGVFAVNPNLPKQ